MSIRLVTSLAAGLISVQAGGAEVLRLTDDPHAEYDPAWSPSGDEIAFVRETGSVSQIWIASLQGGERLLVDDASSPSWSADGSQLAFMSGRAGNLDLWIVPASGGLETPLTTDPAPDWQPAWSGDGSEIAFARGGDIWAIDVASRFERQVTADLPGHAFSPAWSSDGSTIIFDILEEGTLWRVPAEGGMAYQCTALDEIHQHAAWAPSGQYFATRGTRRGGDQIPDVWILEAACGTGHPLTFDASENYDPSWSPDGALIAFVSTRSGNDDIWIMDIKSVGVDNPSWGATKARYRSYRP